ncbi:MAG: hypothetical protein GTN97_04420 [Nitrosopumilaceae archaeon]|nr:hypothetical protein [Nitrosopumilaceae archaeon]NIP10284.1 hypothetical protein [Nitrosopumilaceae archaeon]NIS95147.1 hypothetical protein [Nitrosopumilaceae archaeon]
MASIIQSKINQRRLLTAELKQLDYDFEKASTLQEKVAIHNLIVTKGVERQKNEDELRLIKAQNRVTEYAKSRKTRKRK